MTKHFIFLTLATISSNALCAARPTYLDICNIPWERPVNGNGTEINTYITCKTIRVPITPDRLRTIGDMRALATETCPLSPCEKWLFRLNDSSVKLNTDDTQTIASALENAGPLCRESASFTFTATLIAKYCLECKLPHAVPHGDHHPRFE